MKLPTVLRQNPVKYYGNGTPKIRTQVPGKNENCQWLVELLQLRSQIGSKTQDNEIECQKEQVPEAVPMGTGKMISILAMKPTERKLTLKRITKPILGPQYPIWLDPLST